MHKLVRFAILIALLANSCQEGATTSTAPPDFSTEAADQLRARAFASACRALLCEGSPIYTAAGDQELLDAIAMEFTDEVVPLPNDELEELTGADGRYSDGGTFISIQRVYRTDHSDIAAVDV
jgi:hypothetical protein